MDARGDIPATLARLKELAPAGFAVVLHMRFTAPTYLFQTYPREWVERYSRGGYVVRDPAVIWCFANTGAVRWSELAGMDEGGVLREAADYGLRHGVSVGVLRANSRSISGFARDDREFTDAEIAEIEAAVIGLHDVTASAKPLPEDVRESLRLMSIAVTHP